MAKKISASVGKGGKNKPVDTSGQVTLGDGVDRQSGSPPPSHVLTFSGPATGPQEYVVVAFPIGREFAYDPIELGPATALDFSLDVLAEPLAGAARLDVTLAVLQDQFFVAPPSSTTPSLDGTEGVWTRLSHSGLEAEDFQAAGGGNGVPDFSEPFQFAYAFHAEYSTTLSVELRLDNMEATIHTVPEPTSGFLLAVAMGTAVLWRRWWSSDDA